jgi:hypothetical protein
MEDSQELCQNYPKNIFFDHLFEEVVKLNNDISKDVIIS